MIKEDDIYQLIELVFKQDRKKLSRETSIEDFAKDSMDIMEFIAVLESKYKVKIDPSEVTKLKNIGEIIDYAEKNQATDSSES